MDKPLVIKSEIYNTETDYGGAAGGKDFLNRDAFVTNTAGVQPIDRGPSPRPWTVTCNQTVIRSPVLPFDDLHSHNPWAIPLTNPGGMQG